MAKIKSTYYCQNCGSQSSKWIGKCPSCNEWNTYVEEIVQKQDNIAKLISGTSKKTAKPNLISEVKPIASHRIIFEDKEFNEKRSNFELTYTSIVKINEEIKNKKELEKILLCDVQNKIYPNLKKIFVNLLENSGFSGIKFDKKVDFNKLYNEKFS